ncbi:MAG: AmmeMemoRadiSam system protein A [Candidatus Marinimicrobia bacterium]|nr:AmmeMemoRadiSam system protein A [Candidatus Neomarinimicrobiota bacterium]
MNRADKTERIEVGLSERERARLLALARAAALYFARNRRVPSIAELGFTPTPAESLVQGAFVTLYRDGRLRGCVGEIMPQRPLCEAVLGQAVNPAFHDGRFMPCTAPELKEVSVEISALSPPCEVTDYSAIALGRHGIVLSKSGRSAVFLPQVPGEQGWDLPCTLTHLARKAGLPPDAWKINAHFQVFEATVFRDDPAR